MMNTPLDTTIDVETLTDTELEAHEAAARALIDELGIYMWKIDVERWSREFPKPVSIPVMASVAVETAA